MPVWRDDLWTWINSHRVTSIFALVHVLSSILCRFLSIPAGILAFVLTVIASRDPAFVILHVIFFLLFSGVESSIGSVSYLAWLISSGSLVWAVRLLLRSSSVGPSFVVFTPAFTFLSIHKPILYFRVRQFNFPDTLLYAAAVFQYLLNDVIGLSLDLASCLVANLIWKLGIWLVAAAEGDADRHEQQPPGDTGLPMDP
jgi:hypothetical protein